ncbi:MAG: phospholipase D family protein [Bacteroidetes bacterium]|jgi:cardiolipin synthase C|nr:phospholipase D family protein [Candidatus Neomarinimicrobiota bacterium]MBT5528784.1 phospholipase D family protein [Cytophagia bacterium]MBT7040858.1 phospholipase D family protein [Bacteroidota bacterium]MBT4852674.1 phospholipase D family protein [Candidatus Neomarinimicrobiota bacterium]MBT6217497.1 phospholipase D family protein [Candidatus Neomarinimicrobiota bacterium]
MNRVTKQLPYFLLAIILSACSSNKPNLSQYRDMDVCADTPRDSTMTLSYQLSDFSEQLLQKTGVYLLDDGIVSLVARAWATESAEKSIDVQYFIFSADNVGLIAVDHLLRAAQRGVKVRILVDDITLKADADYLLAVDSHPNLSIKIYNPNINLGKTLPKKLSTLATDFRGANQRMHNKSVVVDGLLVITGGRNIADEYFDYNHKYNFRDRDVLLLGSIAGTVQSSFNKFWNDPLSKTVTRLVKSTKSGIKDSVRIELLHQYACDPKHFLPELRKRIKRVPNKFESIHASDDFQWVDSDSVSYISDVPGKSERTSGLLGGGISTDALINLVRKAKTSVTIQTPYLVTTELGQNLFRDAVNRGVEVKIITNSLAATDNLGAFSGYQRDRHILLEAGVKIFEFRPDAAVRLKKMSKAMDTRLHRAPVFGLHAKSMVVDGEIAIIGTFNLDPRSANLNTECITVIHSDIIASRLQKVMDEECEPENAWAVTLESHADAKAGFIKRFRVWIRRIIPKEIL